MAANELPAAPPQLQFRPGTLTWHLLLLGRKFFGLAAAPEWSEPSIHARRPPYPTGGIAVDDITRCLRRQTAQELSRVMANACSLAQSDELVNDDTHPAVSCSLGKRTGIGHYTAQL